MIVRYVGKPMETNVSSVKTKKNYMTPNEVAELLMVSPVTVRQWAQKGKLDAMTTPGGHRRFSMEAIEKFAAENNMSLSPRGNIGPHILIVDDDVSLANFLMEVLQQRNSTLQVKVVHDGFSAGRQIESFTPDIVLLDLMMPQMDGFEVCHMIKESNANIRVIAMSGFCSDENKQRILAEGAECCLKKPFSTTVLMTALGVEEHPASTNMRA